MTISAGVQHIGLFGGTFDPVHQGHLALARHVLDRCRLDRLFFIPAPQPPHKQQPEAPFRHRVAMLEAAMLDCADPRLQLSLIEEELPTPSYTINTVEALIARYGIHHYSLIIGADSLLDLPQWHRAERLMELVSLIVVKRDSVDMTTIQSAVRILDPAFAFDPQQNKWFHPRGVTVEYLADLELPVASSTIREQLRRGTLPAMLPPKVLAYIRQHSLYDGPCTR